MRGILIPRWLITLLAATLLFAACTADTPSSTSTAGPATTGAGSTSTTSSASGSSETTTATPTTTQPSAEVDTPLVIAGDGLDDQVVEQLSAEIAELILATEQVRGLPFLARPTVTILTPQELEARVRADIAEEIDSDELAVETRVLQLFGLLQPGDDLEQMLIDLYGEQVAGFYDGDTGEMVIGGEAAELTPYTKTVIVHELIHALTDQHFLFNDDYEAMWDEERYEEGAAFQALIEGDATYFQIVYMQGLSLVEQLAMAQEALELYEASSATATVPDWMLDDLSFPYETGQVFVQSLVDAGGIAAVDRAYQHRPVSTEVVMHPSRYSAGEVVLAVPPVDVSLEGFETYESASYGEWGFRLLLGETAASKKAVQAANGWGGDAYQVLYDSDDIVFALAYKGDSEDDAFELADALIQMIQETLEMGDGLADDGGVSFTAEDGRYAFLDRIGDGFVFVLATDAVAGAAAADQLTVP